MKIYFKINDVIKDFYFVSLGKDQSIYFGSSAAKFFKKGYAGHYEVPKEGKHVDVHKDGRPLTTEEIRSKHSLHKSGILLGPSLENGKRYRYRVAELNKYNEPIPLVGIFPMIITKYPQTNNKIVKEDFLINLVSPIYPFALLLFLKYPHQDEPKLIRDREKWDFALSNYITLGPYMLGIFIYSKINKFTAWPELEINVTATPDEDTGKIPFPIFESLP